MSTATVLRALDALAPVELDELVERAALLTRVDRKYLLTTDQVAGVLSGLPDGTRVLQIDGRRDLGYASTYFDTADGQSYRTTRTARRRRWKVRTRRYLDSGTCWLEVKTRGPRGTTVKTRQPHPEGMPRTLTPAAVAFVEQTLRRSGIPVTEDGWHAAPVLDTVYRRTTLALPDGRSRATVDTGLVWRAPDGTELARDDLVVVETKTGSSPSQLDRALWAAGRRPDRISKFGTGMALLDPALPAHRWHRVLAARGPLVA